MEQKVLYDDAGVQYLPVSDYYKRFVSEQLLFALNLGEDVYNNTRVALTEKLAIDSDYPLYKSLNDSLRKEILDLLRIPYESMKAINEPKKPKLRLVK